MIYDSMEGPVNENCILPVLRTLNIIRSTQPIQSATCGFVVLMQQSGLYAQPMQ